MTTEQIKDIEAGANALLAVVASELSKRVVYLRRADFLSTALKQRLLAMQAVESTTPADFFNASWRTTKDSLGNASKQLTRIIDGVSIPT